MGFQRIKTYLQQLEEADFSFKASWPRSLSIAVVVTFLVYYFIIRHTPFVFSKQLIYSACFGGITILVSLGNDLIWPRIFPKWYNEVDWTLGKEIAYLIWQFFTIAVLNLAFMVFMGWIVLSASSFAQILFLTAVVGLFPVSILRLMRHNQKLKRRLAEAIELNEHLGRSTSNSTSKGLNSDLELQEESISLSSNQQRISILLAEFLYASSEKNYLRIVLHEKEDLLIRNTIKKLEQTLSAYPGLVRCHRAYVVNTKKVIAVSGNAQGYRLKLEACADEVPVSRSYISTIRKLIA